MSKNALSDNFSLPACGWVFHLLPASKNSMTKAWLTEKVFYHMNRKFSLFFLFLLVGLLGWSQGDGPGKKAEAEVAKYAQPLQTATAGPRSAVKGDSAIRGPLQNVLFATNEDCRLFVNEEAVGLLSKKNFLHLNLPAGTYRYTAKSQTTGDEWRDTFSIAEGKPAEVFVDMLYTIDKGRELVAESRLAALAKNKKTPTQGTTKVPEGVTINVLVANMVPVKGGTFVMGNNKSPSADEAEHPVMLSGFYMSKYEVTQEQWESIMGYNPSIRKDCPTCPVENVSWEEVMIFIRKVNSLGQRKFRLPTEAEWEYVAKMGGKAEIERAGGTEAYIKKTAWAFTNSENRVHPVGKKQPNVSGIYDLIGNVSEWCMDWYGAFFYKEDLTEKDPGGPPLGKDKVVRGGNYKDYNGDRFRPSFRNKVNPKYKGGEIGFRLVMEGQE
jgi:formylglycine-generating enzyme required for sulfatase activity